MDPAQTQCQIPMAVLTAAPYSLTSASAVVAKVRAHNALGWSGWSPEGGSGTSLIQTAPQKMNPVVSGAATTDTQIEVTWS